MELVLGGNLPLLRKLSGPENVRVKRNVTTNKRKIINPQIYMKTRI